MVILGYASSLIQAQHQIVDCTSCKSHYTVKYSDLLFFTLALTFLYPIPSMVVSWNRGTPKSSILDWDFPWNNPTIFGYPHDYGNPHIVYIHIYIYICWLNHITYLPLVAKSPVSPVSRWIGCWRSRPCTAGGSKNSVGWWSWNDQTSIDLGKL